MSKSSASKRTALVTGAGQGMGLGVARRRASGGSRVLVNDGDAQKAEQAAAEIRSSGGEALAAPFDVTDFEAVEVTYAALPLQFLFFFLQPLQFLRFFLPPPQ